MSDPSREITDVLGVAPKVFVLVDGIESGGASVSWSATVFEPATGNNSGVVVSYLEERVIRPVGGSRVAENVSRLGRGRGGRIGIGTMERTMSRTGIVAVALVAGLGTAVVSAWAAQPRITPDDVLSGERLGASATSATSIKSSEVLALSDEMRQFLREHVNAGGTDIFKLQQLVDAIMGTADFQMEYDENTRTAAETFRLRRGNCLSFTTMFVTLARGAGLHADFQEVDIPPDWSTGRDVFMLNRHINVVVEMGMSGSRAVDFDIGDFKSTYEVEEIPDSRAVAHFFNNMGVERMQEGDSADAVAFFRQAILETNGRFSPAWTNLGLLYRRAGFVEYAEAAYLQAIEVDKRDYVAMSNLVRLYEELGDPDAADAYRKKVNQHRLHNPHLRYSLARKAFAAGDYDTAIEHLEYAIRKAKDEPEYYFLLSLCYLEKGNRAKAIKWASRADRAARTAEQGARYSSKLEVLKKAADR